MVIQGYRRLLLIIILLLPSLVIAAGDQSSCIQIVTATKPSTGNEARALKNTCDYSVYVFWCLSGIGDATCGGQQFYTRGHKIEDDSPPYFNKYSIPMEGDIQVGACKSRRSVSFSDNESYSCQVTDEPVSTGAVIYCGGDIKISYKWKPKKVTERVAIVRLATANNHYWVNIDSAEYNKFIVSAYKFIPASFKSQICNDSENKISSYSKWKNEVIGEINENSYDERAQCLDELMRSEKCNKILNSGNTNAGTGERQ